MNIVQQLSAILLLLSTLAFSTEAEIGCHQQHHTTQQTVLLDQQSVNTLFIIDSCSYQQGLKLNASSTQFEAVVVLILNTSISESLELFLNMTQGCSVTIESLRGVTTAPTLSIIGSLVYSSSLSITDSSLAVVTAALTLSNCATVTILRSSMTQLVLPAASASLAASSSFLIHSSSIVTVPESGQLDAIQVACAMVDSVFELWNSTVIGDIQAGITFNSSAITTILKQGTNNLINITANTLVLRSTTATINTGSVIKQFVLGFTAPPSLSSTACYLRSGTQLTLSGNTLTSFAPNSNLPLMYIYSLGALVAHDGSNKGTGGRLEFVSGGTQSVGPQLAIRRYTALLSITLTVLAPMDNATFWVDNCTTGTLSIAGSAQLLTRANVFFENSLATSQLIVSAQFLNSTIAVDNVTVQSGVVAINTVAITNTTMDIRRCVALGISAAGLVMSSSIISIRETKATSSGVGLAGSASSSSTVYIDNNTITSTTAVSALSVGMTVNAGCFVALIRNCLSGSSSGNGISWTGASYNSSLLVSQNTAVGDYYHSGNVQGPTAFLNLSGNVFSPLAASTSIFTLSNLGDGARLCVDDSNRFLGGKAFSVTLPLTKATTVSETVRVYLSLLSSVIGLFTFSGVPNAVANNYSGSVIAIRSTPIGGAVSISLPYANGVNVLLRDSPITGSLSFSSTSAQNVYFICESSTMAKITITGAITISGSLASSSAIVLNGIQNGVGITASFSSSCPSKAASCLFALWNCDVLTNNIPLSFTGAVGSFTHIDLYRSSFNSNDNPGVHAVTFASGAPSSSASISVIEMKLVCANTGLWDDDAYPMNIPSSPMSGGFEIWGSYLYGDYFVGTWTNGNMKFFWAFSNYIEQGSYFGAGLDPTNGQGGTACNSGGSSFFGGGDIGGVPSASCSPSVTKLRCTHDSQFSKAPYYQGLTVSVVGSCMVLPIIDLALSGDNVPMSGFVESQFDVNAGGELASILTSLTCSSRCLLQLSSWYRPSFKCFFTIPRTASSTIAITGSFTQYTESLTKRFEESETEARYSASSTKDISETESPITNTQSIGPNNSISLAYRPTITNTSTHNLYSQSSSNEQPKDSATAGSKPLQTPSTKRQTELLTPSSQRQTATLHHWEIVSARGNTKSLYVVAPSQTIVKLIPRDNPYSIIDRSTKNAAAVVGVLSVTVGVVAIPIASMRQGVSMALLRMSQCQDDALNGEPLEVPVHPFRFPLGDGKSKYGRGAVVGNLLVIPTFWGVLCYLFIPLLIRRIKGLTLPQARDAVGWPGTALLPFTVVCEGSAMASVGLVSTGAVGDVILGCLGLIVIVLTVIGWASVLWKVKPNVKCQRVPREGMLKMVEPRSEWELASVDKAPLPLLTFLGERSSIGYLEKRISLIGSSWWLWSAVAAHSLSMVVGIAEGLPTSHGNCRIRWTIAVVASLLQAVVVMTNTVPIELLLLGVLGLLNCALACVISLSTFGVWDPEDASDVLNGVGLASSITGIILLGIGALTATFDAYAQWRKGRVTTEDEGLSLQLLTELHTLDSPIFASEVKLLAPSNTVPTFSATDETTTNRLNPPTRLTYTAEAKTLMPFLAAPTSPPACPVNMSANHSLISISDCELERTPSAASTYTSQSDANENTITIYQNSRLSTVATDLSIELSDVSDTDSNPSTSINRDSIWAAILAEADKAADRARMARREAAAYERFNSLQQILSEL